MLKKNIITLFERLKANNPKPTTELIYNSNFELLIAVVLSAQATDISVNKVTPNLFKDGNKPEDLIKLGLDEVKNRIKSIGLYQTKAKNILKTCEILITKHNSDVPNTRVELEELAGVGRKTANVILNTLFNQPTIAVDTHIFRVSNRLKLAPGKTVLEVEKKLMKAIPKEYLQDAHHWLILHGRYTCKARNPDCENCILNDLCPYPKLKLKITKAK
jgi:endonuclease III